MAAETKPRMQLRDAAVGFVAGLAASAVFRIVLRRKATGSLTNTGAGGAAAYETARAVEEYLQFHYAQDEEILPYKDGPKEALHFTARLAKICSWHSTGDTAKATALDLGCAVGGASFELARTFGHVTGLDYSHSFVDACNKLKDKGMLPYQSKQEGVIMTKHVATVPTAIDRSRVRFQQGDACNLPTSDFGPFDAVLAANLLCRLPDPAAFLRRAAGLVKSGGVLVLVSPFSWLEEWTPKSKWLGGYVNKGKEMRTKDAITAALSGSFSLAEEADVPFLIREHARKFQWGCSHASVWIRK